MRQNNTEVNINFSVFDQLDKTKQFMPQNKLQLPLESIIHFKLLKVKTV